MAMIYLADGAPLYTTPYEYRLGIPYITDGTFHHPVSQRAIRTALLCTFFPLWRTHPLRPYYYRSITAAVEGKPHSD